jgi:rRNA maturation endonuclease Nob1
MFGLCRINLHFNPRDNLEQINNLPTFCSNLSGKLTIPPKNFCRICGNTFEIKKNKSGRQKGRALLKKTANIFFIVSRPIKRA